MTPVRVFQDLSVKTLVFSGLQVQRHTLDLRAIPAIIAFRNFFSDTVFHRRNVHNDQCLLSDVPVESI